ncbi:Bug family tripartite tricarboxylate transporter substrate binding protein [Ottowia sp.]|uniref:Bug family tripartite tricarboxylate transporter substrate binding protein n=1 Tax=Ottowia sp. TaxID=1898956 RepID=UPI0039E5B4A7
MNTIDRRALLRQGLAATGALALGGAARAQDFPVRPVRLFTPFPAGSGPDASLRLVAEQLSRRWEQPVVVDNRPGGNGFIAVAAFKQGAADGHDLIQLDSTHVTAHPSTFAQLPYDVQRDFAPLRMILRTPFFVAVGAGSPYRSLDDLVRAARARPGRVSYGSWFNGSPGHLGGLLMQAQMDLSMLHVPFRDFGQLYTAVANRDVDWALASAATAGPLEKAGRLRFIALAAPRRDPLYPGVPATAESPSTRGYEISAWAALFGPAAIAGARQNALAADIAQALAAPDVARAYETLGYEAPDLPPGRLDALIRRETARWGEIIKAAHLRLD